MSEWVSKREWFNTNRSRLLLRFPSQCVNCFSTEALEVHHIVPLALGGTNRSSNLTVLCSLCHDKAHMSNRSSQRRAAQAAGIARAKAAGKQLGRRRTIDAESVVKWRGETGASIRQTALHFGISTASVKRACRQEKV